MEDFSAPSFSLGLDLGIADLPTEGEEEEEEANLPTLHSSPDQRQNEEERFCEPSIQESEEIAWQKTLDEAQEEDPSPRVLKRLRRGPPPTAGNCRPPVDGSDLMDELSQLTNLCDEIEDFSSPEKDPKRFADDYPSTQSHITCSNTKFSLQHRGFLRDNSESKRIASKVSPASGGVSTLSKLESSNKNDFFPRLTVSPIRKINLIDLDSDDSSASKETPVSLRKGTCFHEECSTWESQKDLLDIKPHTKSFWKDFSPKKNSKFETPALDEFCKEYFRSATDQNVNQHKVEMKSSGVGSSRGPDTVDLIDVYEDLSSPQPPAYQYFYHTDPKIQTLVRQRLPHFIPLGVKTNSGAQQFGAQNLDYMSQFSPTFAGRKPQTVPEKASRSNKRKKPNSQSQYNDIQASDATGSWVNPRSKVAIPKDAGKRRVSADVRQSGHWFTDQDGKKVYVSKDGEKSTGRIAYTKYRKEAAAGFRKFKKKGAVKKKNQKSKR